MARYPKPTEGSWTADYPDLGTEPVSYEDSISPEFYELERDAIFRRAWLQVGRLEQLPRTGSFFTKDIAAANTSIIVVRDGDDVRAFHNVCRHRGNKLVWQDYPNEETRERPASSPASTTGGATGSTAPAPSRSKRESSSTSTRPSTAWFPCTATCSRGSSS